jgi:hypothetical protein
MNRLLVGVFAATLAFAVPELIVAQGKADVSGEWTLNNNRSDPGVGGNSPTMAFPTTLVIKQMPGTVEIEARSTRQDALEGVYKLDESEVTVPGPVGITVKARAKMDGEKLIVNSKRSFSSPAGDITVDIEEVYSAADGILTVEKTQNVGGKPLSTKAVYEKSMALALAAPTGGRGTQRAPAGPPPRTADGKPDMRGGWVGDAGATFIIEEHAAGFGVAAGKSLIIDPPDGKFPYTPAALAERDRRRMVENAYEDPTGKCIISGVPRLMNFSFEIEYVPGYFLFNSTQDFFRTNYRAIPLDGRPHLPDKIRLWQGDSVGHWEGDALVIDSTNFNGKTWLALGGDFQSDAVHVVERFEMRDANTLDYQATMTDPKIYTRPVTLKYGPFRRVPLEEDVEDSCHEGNTEIAHLANIWKAAKAKAQASPK